MNAAPKVCFDKPEAQKLLVEVKYGQVTAEKLGICQQSYSTARTINKNNDILIDGLKKDKVDLTKLSEEYKQRYVDTNQKLIESEESKPSRLTWFGVGFLSAAVLGILGIFAISK